MCIAVWTAQWFNERATIRAASQFCSRDVPAVYDELLVTALGKWDAATCKSLMDHIRAAPDARDFVYNKLLAPAPGSPPPDSEFRYLVASELMSRYYGYQAAVPERLTQALWYPPASWDVFKMLTATLAHGSWQHLLSNLFFFFAFAAAVETILGRIRFLLVGSIMAIGAFGAYSLATLGPEPAPPTLGLSGVVYGMMALFAWFQPTASIRCLFVFFLFFRRLLVPAWLMASWFVGLNLIQLAFDDGQSGVNMVAHVAGAIVGYTLGALAFRSERKALQNQGHIEAPN